MVSYLDDFDVFVSDYNDGLKRSEIMFKLGWSGLVYRFAYYYALRLGRINARGSGRVPRFYSYDARRGVWLVKGRAVDGGSISITCSSEELAVRVVDLLFEYGWCKSSVGVVKRSVGLL